MTERIEALKLLKPALKKLEIRIVKCFALKREMSGHHPDHGIRVELEGPIIQLYGDLGLKIRLFRTIREKYPALDFQVLDPTKSGTLSLWVGSSGSKPVNPALIEKANRELVD